MTLEDTLRALEEGGGLVDRARGVLEEIGRVQASVFEPGGVGENGRLECKYLSGLLWDRTGLMYSITAGMYVQPRSFITFLSFPSPYLSSSTGSISKSMITFAHPVPPITDLSPAHHQPSSNRTKANGQMTR